ncbi:MAG: nitroreductase [Clostridia bacterium]|nr:nitroreductase [Clostridia bacterium]
MDVFELVKSRRSVRSYVDKEIPQEIVEKLNAEIIECNRLGDLNMQLVLNDRNAFGGMKANYGLLKGVTNYIVMVGKKSVDLSERLGYYGERVVLKAQELGLNTCWVGMSLIYNDTKGAYVVNDGESKKLIIAIGYGENQGHPRKTKSIEEVSVSYGDTPEWFKRGVECALYAPTAMNQQKFKFYLYGDKVKIKYGLAVYGKVDKGIVKYHFELGAGKDNFTWL